MEQGFEYLVFAEGIFGRFYAEPEKYASEIAQYDAFFERFELIRLFTDGGYEVRVYRVNPEQSVLPLHQQVALAGQDAIGRSTYTYSSKWIVTHPSP